MASSPKNGARHGGKTLPHNLDCEASILGGLLVKPDLLPLLATLEIDDFYHHQHKVVFEAIRNLQAKNKPIDVVTVEAEIQHKGKLDAIGGIAFLGELALRVPTVDNVLAYTKTVRDLAMMRRLAITASGIADRAYTWDDQPDEYLLESVGELQRIEREYREADERIPLISVGAALEQLDVLAATPIYATPFPELNKAIGFGGCLVGQVYVIVSGTGGGKTSLVAKLAKHHAENGGDALIATFEMFAAYYVARMAAEELGVHSNRILRNEIKASEVMAAVPRRLHFLNRPTLQTLRRAIEQIKRSGRPAPLVVVDYIQALAEIVASTMERPDPRLANALVSRELVQLAQDCGVPILVVSATSRSTSKKLAADVRKTPPRDLVDAAKETSQIEYDSAGVIVLSLADEHDLDGQIATISVAKARFGETCHIDARYNGQRGSWTELGRVVLLPKNDSATQNASALRDAIVRVIKQSGPQKSRNAIHKLVGRRKEAVISEVDSMLDAGILCWSSDRLTLPELVPQAPATPAQTQLENLIREAQS